MVQYRDLETHQHPSILGSEKYLLLLATGWLGAWAGQGSGEGASNAVTQPRWWYTVPPAPSKRRRRRRLALWLVSSMGFYQGRRKGDQMWSICNCHSPPLLSNVLPDYLNSRDLQPLSAYLLYRPRQKKLGSLEQLPPTLAQGINTYIPRGLEKRTRPHGDTFPGPRWITRTLRTLRGLLLRRRTTSSR